MKIKHSERFSGWAFLSVGLIVMILAVHVSVIKNTSFILDEEIFRAMITGLIVCMTGFVLLAIHRVNLALQNYPNGSTK